MTSTPASPAPASSFAPAPDGIRSAHAAEPAISQRVDTLIGNRPCASCGFNLHGQTVVREPVYNMLIVRCPECAAIASLQEYPALGRWGDRLRFVAAAAWIGCLMFLVIALVASCVSIIMGAMQSETNSLGQVFLVPYTEHIKSLTDAERIALSVQPGSTGLQNLWYTTFDESWWAKQSLHEILDQSQDKLWGTARLVLVILQSSITSIFPLALILSVALPHLRTRGRLILVAVLVALTLAILAIGGGQVNGLWGPRVWWGAWGARGSVWNRVSEILHAEYFWQWAILSMLITTTFLMIGLFAGRIIARWLIVLLLPPKMRVPWAFLWHADNKPLPKPRALA